jgi:hypothetical protein
MAITFGGEGCALSEGNILSVRTWYLCTHAFNVVVKYRMVESGEKRRRSGWPYAVSQEAYFQSIDMPPTFPVLSLRFLFRMRAASHRRTTWSLATAMRALSLLDARAWTSPLAVAHSKSVSLLLWECRMIALGVAISRLCCDSNGGTEVVGELAITMGCGESAV